MKVRVGIIAACLAVCMMVSVGCSSAPESETPNEPQSTTTTGSVSEEKPLSAMVLKGPSAISAVQLMNRSDNQESSPYDITMVGTPDEVVSALSSGSIDAAVIPTNLAANLYNKTEGDVRMVAITTLGSLYIVENGNEVQSIADLRGKTVYSAGQGANPQFILEYLINRAGLTIGEDVFIEYVAEQSEALAMLAAEQADVVLLPEPFATVALSKGADVRMAVDLSYAWEEITGDDFAMSCVVAHTSYLEENPEGISSFMADLKESVDATAIDLETVAELSVTYEIVSDYETAFAAIPNCRIVYIDGEEMKGLLEDYFEVLFDANPASLGGSIPDDALFYE